MDVTEKFDASLQWPDYVAIALVLLISALIGVYYRFSGGRQKTTEEYFTANHSMSIPLLATALMVAFISAIALLGASGEVYIYGTQIAVINLGFILGTPITAHLYLPVFYHLQSMSVYEYLEKRFGKTAALAASIANFLQMCLSMGVVLYAPALALEATTGLSSTMSIIFIGFICTFYSSVGGIKAVLATDVFQGVLMLTSVVCIIVVGSYDIEGGISEVWNIAAKGDRLEFFNLELDPTARVTLWSVIMGGIGIFLSDYAISQVFMQRLLSAKPLKAVPDLVAYNLTDFFQGLRDTSSLILVRNLRSAQLALYINTVMLVIMSLALCFAGLVLYAWFVGCDPVTSGLIASYDQVMPYFAKIRLSKIPGLAGIFIVGIFSAGLSTLSAILNSLAAVAVADYITPLYRKFGRELTDSKKMLMAKSLCVFNGILCVGVAFMSSQLGTLLQAVYAIRGSLGGPILGLFSLGLFVESANERGSVIGTFMSLVLCSWMSFGRPKPPVPELSVSVDKCINSTVINATSHHQVVNIGNIDNSDYFYLYRISYMWYTPIGFAATMIFGYIASLVDQHFAKQRHTSPDPELFTPMLCDRIRRRRERRGSFIGNNTSKTTTTPMVVINKYEFNKPK